MTTPTRSSAAERWRTFRRNKLALFGTVLLVLLMLFCFLGPLLYPTDQIHTALELARLAPGEQAFCDTMSAFGAAPSGNACGAFPLGTDDLGYDVLGRLMQAGQTSLVIGLAAGALATVIGTLWGSIAGYFGGFTDAVMMRVVDAGIAIPALFLLVVAATLVTPSVPVLIVVIGLVSWLVPARLMRAESLALRSRAYVEAMRLAGGTGLGAIRRHIIPNAIGTAIVNATFQVADAILLVTYVSFLGLGVPPPAANWGGMLSGGLAYSYDGYWWLIFPPGLLIVLTVCAFTFIGDGLRDAFDVRYRER